MTSPLPEFVEEAISSKPDEEVSPAALELRLHLRARDKRDMPCKCGCPDGPCEHVWKFSSNTCSRCHAARLDHDIWVRPDKPLPEDEAIRAAHPTRTKANHFLYEEAVRFVSAKHSKSALVDLVNWLLVQRLDLMVEVRRLRAVAISASAAFRHR